MTGYIDAALSGVIVKDGELKHSGRGTAYLGLTIRIGDGDGAQFVRVTCFGDTAAELAQIAKKGARLIAEGALTADVYQCDGKATPSLSVAARWARIPAVGKNRPKRDSAGAGRREGYGGEHSQRQGASGRQRGQESDCYRHTFDDKLPL
jgi:single-stranded DNA-binding protein